MATFQKRGASWRAIVRKNGSSTSATFSTKAAAQSWALKIEAEMDDTGHGAIPNKTFGELLQRYAEDVSPGKKGGEWEKTRIEFYKLDSLAQVRLPDINATHFTEWRDRRLKVVTAGTVLRDWNLLSNACNKAVHEWHWLKVNPMSRVKRPAEVPPRDQLISQDAIDKLLFVLGDDIKTIPGRTAMAMRFALETAMRTGEIAGLTWEKVFLGQQYCKTSGKTAAATRDVSLSPAAIEILEAVGTIGTTGSVFNLSASQMGSAFQKAKKLAGVDGIHFHDTRANAITMLSKKLDVLTLARMIGHKDLQMLMVYYRESAQDIAKKLG
jgi:integrase